MSDVVICRNFIATFRKIINANLLISYHFYFKTTVNVIIDHSIYSHATSLAEDGQRSELICMLAVPAMYTIHDLLKFNGPCL